MTTPDNGAEGHRWMGATGKLFLDRHTECHYCGKTVPRKQRSRDHIVPKCFGGSSLPYNFVMACKVCNELKNDDWPTCQCLVCTTALMWFARGLKSTRRFGVPRCDQWYDWDQCETSLGHEGNHVARDSATGRTKRWSKDREPFAIPRLATVGICEPS